MVVWNHLTTVLASSNSCRISRFDFAFNLVVLELIANNDYDFTIFIVGRWVQPSKYWILEKLYTCILFKCNSTSIGKVIWISWSIMSTALNLFLLLVFGVHLIRAIIARLDLVASATYENEDKSLVKQTLFHLWKYEESRECFNIFLPIFWTKVTKKVVTWKSRQITTCRNLSRHVDSRPRSRSLFGLCALHFIVICGISSICSLSCCTHQNCLNVIGL